MISKGTTHNDGARLADYMTTGKDGERAELWQLRGFGMGNITDAFRCVHAMAEATRAQQPFFHVQVRNREGETLTRPQWEHAADRIERPRLRSWMANWLRSVQPKCRYGTRLWPMRSPL